MKIDPYLPPCKKLKCKWIKNLNMKPDTLNPMGEQGVNSLECDDIGDNFLNRIPNRQALRSTRKNDASRNRNTVKQRALSL